MLPQQEEVRSFAQSHRAGYIEEKTPPNPFLMVALKEPCFRRRKRNHRRRPPPKVMFQRVYDLATDPNFRPFVIVLHSGTCGARAYNVPPEAISSVRELWRD